MNDWHTFVTQTRLVTDQSGHTYSYLVPPSWKTELQLWDVFQELQLPHDLDSYLHSLDLVCAVVGIVLGIPRSVVENEFDFETVERVFEEVWSYINPAEIIEEEKSKTASTVSVSKDSEFNLANVLAMFGVECGYLPSDVLDMPRRQVIALAEAVSKYVSQKLKFQAAIHGAEVDGEAEPAQIDNEDYWRSLAAKGLPVEVL
ncbi:MAG: hypothetical protein QXT73_00800 [Candidatus Methanomethylicaceae archaeon]